MGRTNRRFTVSQRHNHLEAQDKSGLTVANYCRKNDLPLSTFGNWKQKAQRKTNASSQFIELSLPESPVEFEIQCGTLSLRIPESADFDQLTKVLSAMNRAVL
ncbi:MAG: transposase [Proteobacteria bacterium]|nr:transposase [Pseudomonadota bacterium]